MGIARADTAALRFELYQGLARRNRLVGALRLGVPVLGVALVAAVAVQLYVGGLMRDFSVAGVTIDRNNLVVQAPSYSGMTGDGTRYRVVADSAKVAMDDTDRIEMASPRLTFERAGSTSTTATAAQAQFYSSRQSVSIPGHTAVSDSAGLSGRLQDVDVDFVAETLVARGPVTLRFPSGTLIEAAGMRHDGSTGRWSFERATVTLSATPGAKP